MLARRRVLGAVLWVACALLVVPAAAAARLPAVVLHPDFRPVARNVSDLMVSGDYVGFARSSATGLLSSFVLLDDRTGVRRIIRRADCGRVALGVPWVAFECGGNDRFELYNVATRRWRRIRCDRRCQRYAYLIGSIWVGARWLGLGIDPHQACGDGVHNSCGPETYLFYNIATGKRGSPSVGPRTIVDLNAPHLTRRVCRPLRVPPYSTASPVFPPLLTFFGRFALSQRTTGLYIQRCGSHLDMPLVTGSYEGQLFGNPHAIAICTGSPGSRQRVAGVFLPSLRRFTFILPTVIGCWVAVLGPRRLYLLNTQTSVLWVATFPRDPRTSTRRSRSRTDSSGR